MSCKSIDCNEPTLHLLCGFCVKCCRCEGRIRWNDLDRYDGTGVIREVKT